MRAMLMSTVGLLALAVSSGVVNAADLLVAEPDAVPAVGHDWSGAYAGIAIGGGVTNVDFEGTAYDQGSILALASIGYNWVSGSTLYGIEGDIGVLRGSGDVTDESDSVWTDANFDAIVGSLRGRLGYATENLLLYATAGLAVSSDQFELSPWDGTAVRVGGVVGVGVEMAVADNISIEAEGRYYAFGEGETESDGYTYSSNSAVGLVGLNFHF